MISVEHITTRLGGCDIIRDISLNIGDAEMVAVVGPNGSGKSTLLRTIAGVLTPCSGTVRVAGRPTDRVKKRELARMLGFLAQSAEVPHLTSVQEHIALGRHAYRRLFSAQTAQDTRSIDDAIRTCQLERLRDRRMSELSGGERQRVRLATLLAQDPRCMLLDEPLTGLDIEHQLAILELLRGVNRSRAKTIVCVLHDLDLALRYFDRIVVISDGRLSRDDRADKVLCPETFRSVFKVDGRVGQELSGLPVVVCRKPECLLGCEAHGERAEQPSPPIHVRVRTASQRRADT